MDAEMETQKTYTFEEAVEASNRYFNGDALAAQVWVSKYALKDSDGNISRCLHLLKIHSLTSGSTRRCTMAV